MYEKIKNLEKRVAIIEFFISFFFSFFLTLIYLVTSIGGFAIIGINWLQVYTVFVMFFGLTIFVLNIILPIIQISEKVGTSISDVWKEFKIDYRKKTLLDKVKLFFSIILGFMGVISFFSLFIKI